MSEENVEVAKRGNELLNRGDFDALWELVAEDVVWTWHEAPPGQERVMRGREVILRFLAEWMQLFDHWNREVDEWVDAGDWVITVGRWVGTGRGSGARVAQRRDSSALRYQQGKLVEIIVGLPDRAAALEAAGLSE
jgi:ketosteroid isomerase-like protein